MSGWEPPAESRRLRLSVAAAGLLLLCAGIGTALIWAGNGLTDPTEGDGLAVEHGPDAPEPTSPSEPEDADSDVDEARSGDPESGDAEHGDADESEPEPIGTWRQLPEAPLSPGRVAAAAWTSEEFLVWRGEPEDAAAYDPRADEWRRVAEAPVRAGHPTTGVWTGSELVVLGGLDAADEHSWYEHGAAYDPGSGAWRELPPAPDGEWAWQSAVWDGTAVVVLGSRIPGEGGAEPAAVAYDPDADAWQKLAPPPVWGEGRRLQTAALNGRVIAVGVTPISAEQEEIRALTVLDPETDAWSEPEQVPYMGLWSVALTPVPDREKVAMVGAVQDGMWRDVTGIWSPDSGVEWDALPAKRAWGQHAPELVSVGGGRLVAWSPGAEHAWLLDEAWEKWQPLAAPPLGPRRDAAFAWTGTELLVWGGRTGQSLRDDGAAWGPTSPASPR